jgi:cytoskeletal protein CcmA (bactofilin family)
MLKMTRPSPDSGAPNAGSDYYSGHGGLNPAAADSQTLIGKHISIEGTIRAQEDLVIEGTMKGKIELRDHQVTIGPSANIEADIEANSVVVGGKMVGNIKALGKVEIAKEADFNGEIKAKRIAIEDGAYIKAAIELEREDKKDRPVQQSKPLDAVIVSADPVPADKSQRPVTAGTK